MGRNPMLRVDSLHAYMCTCLHAYMLTCLHAYMLTAYRSPLFLGSMSFFGYLAVWGLIFKDLGPHILFNFSFFVRVRDSMLKHFLNVYEPGGGW